MCHDFSTKTVLNTDSQYFQSWRIVSFYVFTLIAVCILPSQGASHNSSSPAEVFFPTKVDDKLHE